MSEPAKGAGASQGFWEKVGLKPGRQKDRPPGGRDHMVKCKEEGAGGQRGDCRVGSIHRGRVRADVEKAGNSEVTLGEAWKARPISPPRGQCARMLPTLSKNKAKSNLIRPGYVAVAIWLKYQYSIAKTLKCGRRI